MSEQWAPTKLGDVIRVEHGWPFKSELFSTDLSGRPIVVAIGNFRYEGGFRFEDTAIKEYRGEYPDKYTLAPGDILLVMTCQTEGGEILGIPARIPYDGRTYLHNQRMGKVVIKDTEAVDAAFLYHLFRSSDFNSELVASASGTKIVHTAPWRIEAFSFDCPRLDEQRAIAEVLGALDDKIELNREMNHTLEEMASALFKSWFIDFDPIVVKADGRMPSGMDTATAALFPATFAPDPAWGDIPAGWATRPLDKVADFQNGLALQNHRPVIGETRLPVVKIAQLRTGRPDGNEWASASIEESYILEDGDIVFSWSGSLVVVVWCGGRAALNQHLFKVTSSNYPKWFFHQWTLYHLPEFQGIASDKATTMGHIRRFHLTDAWCVVPPRRIIDAASRLMGPWLDLFIQNELESRTLAALRDTLLPRLLSGEVRLKQAAQSVEAAL